MKDYNKENLYRLLALFASVIVVFFAIVTLSVSIKFWWASVPTSVIAIAVAVMLFYKKFYFPGKETKETDKK